MLWAAPTTTDADRKEIIRQIVERVVVDVQGNSERVLVRIEWIGGGYTEGIVIRPVGKLSELSTYPQICQQVQALTDAGWAATAIAQALTDFVPLSKTMAEQIVDLRSWARGRARFATSPAAENNLRKLVA